MGASGQRPIAPDWLAPEARKEWDRVVPELVATGALGVIDTVILASYCETYALWREAAREVAVSGLTVVHPNGRTGANPAAKMMLVLLQEMRRIASEFGFTPAARSRIDLPDAPADGDGLDKFLEGLP